MRALEGSQKASQKAFQGSDIKTRELLRGIRENKIFLNKVSLIYPPDRSVIYYVYKTIKKIKVALVARPDRLRWSRRSDLGRDSVPEQAVPIFGSKGRCCRGWLNLDRLLKNNSAIRID